MDNLGLKIKSQFVTGNSKQTHNSAIIYLFKIPTREAKPKTTTRLGEHTLIKERNPWNFSIMFLTEVPVAEPICARNANIQ